MTKASGGIPSRRSRGHELLERARVDGLVDAGMSGYVSTATACSPASRSGARPRGQVDPVRRLDVGRPGPRTSSWTIFARSVTSEPAVLEERDAVRVAFETSVWRPVLPARGRPPSRRSRARRRCRGAGVRQHVEAEPEALERRLVHVDPPDRRGGHGPTVEGAEEPGAARVEVVGPADLRDRGRRLGGDGVDDLDERAQPGVVAAARAGGPRPRRAPVTPSRLRRRPLRQRLRDLVGDHREVVGRHRRGHAQDHVRSRRPRGTPAPSRAPRAGGPPSRRTTAARRT